jgi:hypothetical protein
MTVHKEEEILITNISSILTVMRKKDGDSALVGKERNWRIMSNLTHLKETVDEVYQRLEVFEGQPTKDFIEESLKNIVLFDEKQRDYGPDNIAKFGEMGLIVRLHDKLARLINLVWDKQKDPTNESIEDSYRDLSNYANIALLVRGGKWSSK